MQEKAKYICSECGAIYSEDDVMEQYGDNAFRIEHIDDCYDDPYIAEVHECPCCGERQETFMGLDDDAIEARHLEFLDDREALMRGWERGLL